MQRSDNAAPHWDDWYEELGETMSDFLGEVGFTPRECRELKCAFMRRKDSRMFWNSLKTWMGDPDQPTLVFLEK